MIYLDLVFLEFLSFLLERVRNFTLNCALLVLWYNIKISILTIQL